jgi:DNA-binding transcriptional ArsR family regulator
MTQRIRNTSITRQRVDNMLRLVAEFHLREMLRDDIREFLGMSPSGVRKYIRELREAKIIDAVRCDDLQGPQHQIYALCASTETVTAFIQSLALPQVVPARKPKSFIQPADPSRHVHVMDDDAQYPVRVRRNAITPDPFALPREFFAQAAA